MYLITKTVWSDAKVRGTRTGNYISTYETNKYCPFRVIPYLAYEDKNVVSPMDEPFGYGPVSLHAVNGAAGKFKLE